jgi:hypothetical protein
MPSRASELAGGARSIAVVFPELLARHVRGKAALETVGRIVDSLRAGVEVAGAEVRRIVVPRPPAWAPDGVCAAAPHPFLNF